MGHPILMENDMTTPNAKAIAVTIVVICPKCNKIVVSQDFDIRGENWWGEINVCIAEITCPDPECEELICIEL